jgi:hypothetical protein
LIETLPERGVAPSDDDGVLFDGIVQLDIDGSAPFTSYISFDTERRLCVSPHAEAAPVSRIALPESEFIDLCHGEGDPHLLIECVTLVIEGEIEPITRLQWLLGTASDPVVVNEFTRLGQKWTGNSIREIPRIASGDVDLRAAAIANAPLLQAGAFEKWPPASWSLDVLEQRFADVPIVHGTSEISLGEYVARIRDGLVTNRGPFKVPEAIFAEMGFPPFLPSAICEGDGRPELYLTARAGVTALHRDVVDGVLLNLFGRRRFTFFTPDQDKLVYPRSNFTSYQICRVDPRRPDLAQYPRFAEARAIDVLLEPGDTLFVPVGWFHQVDVEEHSLAVRFNLHWDWTKRSS